MDDLEVTQRLLDFIQECPSMFHTVATLRETLDREGFEYLPEGAAWNLQRGKGYYTVRNGSSLVAFRVGEDLDSYHFQLTAAHTDSPTFKVKDVPELDGPGAYVRLNVEGYGGMIDSTWFDRPLSVAGRVLVRKDNRIESCLLDVTKPVLLIPNLAIHFNRSINSGYEYNHQIDLCPLFSAGELKCGDFNRMVAEELDVEPDAILGKDLFLVNRQAPTVWGWADEFMSTPKLDDLQCVFAATEAFLQAQNPHDVSVLACFDNEEVGSGTKQGAKSTFLRDTLERVNEALGKGSQDLHRAIAGSFLVSCDNAHAQHPNHPQKTDEGNFARLNGGIVVKETANQSYTTDAFSRAVFCALCDDEGVAHQTFANRSDERGGSTLGNLSNAQVSLHGVDVGLPQLAMHSAYETGGTHDTAMGIRALRRFFETDLHVSEADSVELF